MGDYSGVTNPRRVIERREREAGAQTAGAGPDIVPAAPAASGPLPRVQFARQFTAEERAEQKRKLAEMMRKRGD